MRASCQPSSPPSGARNRALDDLGWTAIPTRAEVVWVWVPYEEDPTQGKDRPVVVIGRRGRALVGVPLTTRSDDREAQIEVGAGDWDPQRRVSYARIWRMLDVDPDQMRREGAIIDRARFDLIVAAVDQYYDVHTSDSPAGTPAGTPADSAAPETEHARAHHRGRLGPVRSGPSTLGCPACGH